MKLHENAVYTQRLSCCRFAILKMIPKTNNLLTLDQHTNNALKQRILCE